MKLTAGQFRAWKTKRITLLGMSGVGKTTLACKLPRDTWFHYSGDYRIGTRYLDEAILDNIKMQAMDVPFLRELLRTDSIYIRSNITIDNLAPISSFLGKIGSPSHGGLNQTEFKRRQALHRHAEISAMRDVPHFIEKAASIYGYTHFINDAGGSVCELEDTPAIKSLSDHTLILYIKASESIEATLIERAIKDPKPLYYRPEFLDAQLQTFTLTYGVTTDEMDPDFFVKWVFPHLFRSRLPRYQAIADEYGYTVDANDIANVRGETDFIELICSALSDNP